MQETRVRSLGWENLLEKGMATHSIILALRVPGQRSLVGYNPWGLKEHNMTEQLKHIHARAHTRTHTHARTHAHMHARTHTFMI